MKAEWKPIDQRISQSLAKNGYEDLSVTASPEGQVQITGPVDPVDRAIVFAIIRAVSGVRRIVFSSSQQKNTG